MKENRVKRILSEGGLALDRVRDAVKKGRRCPARLAAQPRSLSAYCGSAAGSRAGYTNCAPTPEARLLHSLQTQLGEARKLLG